MATHLSNRKDKQCTYFQERSFLRGGGDRRNSHRAAVSDNTSFYIDENNVLYGCGYGNLGQMGDGTTTAKMNFTKLATDVAFVACSSLTTCYIDINGNFYLTGQGQYGQQGNNLSGGSNGNVSWFTKRAENVAYAACSNYTTWYIDTNGNLYGCGKNDYGNQGSGTQDKIEWFTKRAENADIVYCTDVSTFYISSDGILYGCGCGIQCGGGSAENVKVFTAIASGV